MVHDYEYFKKRYKIFIRFLKENNLYEEYRRIIENISVSVSNNTMLERRIFTNGKAFHILMVAMDVKNYPTKKQTYSDFKPFCQFSNYDIRVKIKKLIPKWKRIINKLENKQL